MRSFCEKSEPVPKLMLQGNWFRVPHLTATGRETVSTSTRLLTPEKVVCSKQTSFHMHASCAPEKASSSARAPIRREIAKIGEIDTIRSTRRGYYVGAWRCKASHLGVDSDENIHCHKIECIKIGRTLWMCNSQPFHIYKTQISFFAAAAAPALVFMLGLLLYAFIIMHLLYIQLTFICFNMCILYLFCDSRFLYVDVWMLYVCIHFFLSLSLV